MLNSNIYSTFFSNNYKVGNANMCVSRGGQGFGPPEKSQKYSVSLQYWSDSPKKSMLGHRRHASETSFK